MCRETDPQLAAFRGKRPHRRLHCGLIEIVFGLDIGPVHFGHLYGASELLVLNLDLGFDRLIAVPVDHIDYQGPIIVACRKIQKGDVVETLRPVLRTVDE